MKPETMSDAPSPQLYAGTSTPVPLQRFVCPVCQRSHGRGQFGIASGSYRCLHCGYVGHGYHPDPQIDSDLWFAALELEQDSLQRGLGCFVGVPPEPCPIGYQPTESDLFRAAERAARRAHDAQETTA